MEHKCPIRLFTFFCWSYTIGLVIYIAIVQRWDKEESQIPKCRNIAGWRESISLYFNLLTNIAGWRENTSLHFNLLMKCPELSAGKSLDTFRNGTRDWLLEHRGLITRPEERKWEIYLVLLELEARHCRGYKSRTVEHGVCDLDLLLKIANIIQLFATSLAGIFLGNLFQKDSKSCSAKNETLKVLTVVFLLLLVFCLFTYCKSRLEFNDKRRIFLKIKSFNSNGQCLMEEEDDHSNEPQPYSVLQLGVKVKGLHKMHLKPRRMETIPEPFHHDLMGRERKWSFSEYYHKSKLEMLQINRDQHFLQTLFISPMVNLVSYFASSNFQQSGSTPELQKEGVRLMTYKSFPNSSPASALRLAQAGFFYTGEGDKVKCFCCGTVYQGWRPGDRPQDIHATIAPSCPLVRGQDSSNIPLPEFSRVQNTANHDGPSLSERAVDTLELDGYPDGENMSTLEAAEMHAEVVDTPSSTTSTTSLLAIKPGPSETSAASSHPGNVSVPFPRNNGSSGLSRTQDYTPVSVDSVSGRSQSCQASSRPLPRPYLDLSFAVYPMYALMEFRRRTYQKWQPVRGLPGVEELVMLGFFYAGYADCLRCFYCGIGLKSWEPGDDPCRVHASWRPECAYLRVIKGDDYVDDVTGGVRRQAAGTVSHNRANENVSRPREQTSGVSRDTVHQQIQTDSRGPSSQMYGALADMAQVLEAARNGYSQSEIADGIERARSIGLDPSVDRNLMDVLSTLYPDSSSRDSPLGYNGSFAD